MSDKLNTTDLIEMVSNRSGVETEVVKKVLSAFLDVVTLTLKLGQSVAIRNFGRFQARDIPAKARMVPSSEGQIDCEASRTVSFSASKELRKQVMG